jgi:hypothetical protein
VRIIFGSIFFLFLTSCVSVRIDNYGADKDKSVQFEQPAKPFESIKNQASDSTWKNPESGSVIAYLSECSAALNVDLISIVNDAVSSLKNGKVEFQETSNDVHHAAMNAFVLGTRDEQAIGLRMHLFKKGNCLYQLHFVGSPESLKKDATAFEQFILGFRVP